MTYDHWKTTNPADEELGSQEQRNSFTITLTPIANGKWRATTSEDERVVGEGEMEEAVLEVLEQLNAES